MHVGLRYYYIYVVKRVSWQLPAPYRDVSVVIPKSLAGNFNV